MITRKFINSQLDSLRRQLAHAKINNMTARAESVAKELAMYKDMEKRFSR